MASGTADLQRDLGGALMQSIFGALLAAGYAKAMTAAIGSSPDAKEVTNTTKTELTKSFSSAADTAQWFPKYANQITAAAKSSFLKGDQWAYTAGIVAVLAGAAIVFVWFPRKEREEELTADYQATDAAVAHS
jgi:hypothetical protein